MNVAGKYRIAVTTADDMYKKSSLNHGRLLRLLFETLQADKLNFLHTCE